MKKTVNALGDACPIPVVKTKNAIKELEGPGSVETLVDNEIAVQNLTKMANQKGYAVRSEKIADEYYRGIVRELRQITNQEYMNFDKKYNEIQSGLYGHRFKHHIIFYDFLTDGDVRIIRILHEMMDFKSRLS